MSEDLERRVAELSAELRAAAERLRAAEALHQAQKMDALVALAGGVAHDFNNVLQAIVGFATLLEDGLADRPADLESVAEILKAASRAAERTRSLQAIGRKLPMRVRPVDLRQVVQQAEPVLRRILGEGVALELRLPDEPLVVQADASQLQQVLVNLTANAREAMPGGGALEIALEAAGSGAARLTVSDTGAGIPPELMGRIFEPFFSTKPRRPGRGGAGLGLPVALGIVAQHGGQLEVRARPGGGTVCEVRLPLGPEAAAEEAAQESGARDEARGRGERVLVVEDDALVRASVRMALLRGGYQVAEAGGGAEAVAACREASHDLVLLDLVLPDGNGRDAALEIRRLRRGQRLLFMSGYAAGVLAARGMGSLPARLLQKPVSPPALLRAVRRALDEPAPE